MSRKRNRRQEKTSENSGRQQQAQAEVELQLQVDHSKYDSCNKLLVTSQKLVKKKQEKTQTTSKPKLSKKKRKKLEKILQRKAKTKDRKNIIEELKKYSITASDYSKLISSHKISSKKKKSDSCSQEIKDSLSAEEFKISSSQLTDVINFEHPDCSASAAVDLNVIGFETQKEAEDEEEMCVSEHIERNDVQDELSNNTGKSILESNLNNKVVEDSTKIYRVLEPTEYVKIPRLPDVEKDRLRLPILAEEQVIMEAVRYNPIVIICGETGSGKTTQIPQFLFEAGYAKNLKICVTEPRRVAAISMSKRVSYEMNFQNDVVSYQIRFDGNISNETKICFVTDGILMREIQKDFLLSSFSVIVIDEAHERSIYSDILIGLLSRIVPLRFKKGSPLRLIIMSATLRVEDFTSNSNLFKVEPKILKVQSRQFSVTIHFSKRTPEDYVQEAYLKVCSIHRKYDDGGILVFVTGRQEVQQLCSKLKKTFARNVFTGVDSIETACKSQYPKRKKFKHKQLSDLMPEINLDDYVMLSDSEEENTDEEIESEKEEECGNGSNIRDIACKPIHCLPLFAKLHEEKQAEIFKSPPEGSRLCIIATNIAETSLTIPGIKYVIDTGKVKEKVFDKLTGISTMMITWTSKASADQRAGRAGRISNGHCFRQELYSSAVYKENFPQFSSPEISSKPIDELFLQMKALNIDNVINFPFPTPPSTESLIAAEKRLLLLGALRNSFPVEAIVREKNFSKITDLGKAMAFFPLNPRYSKMLVLSVNHGLVCYVVALVSALTVQEVFINSVGKCDEDGWRNREKLRKKLTNHSLFLGDFMLLLKAVGCSDFLEYSERLIESYGLRYKAMMEIRKLRKQLTNMIKKILPTKDVAMILKMRPPSDSQAKCLRQIALSVLADHVAKKIDGDNLAYDQRNAYKCMETEQCVFLSRDSVLFDAKPEYVVYQEIFESSGKLFMRNVVAVEKNWLPVYAAELCTFSKPLESPSPRFDVVSDNMMCFVTSSFGPHMWSIPATEIEFPECIEKYKWFAKLFLEGEVFDTLLPYKSLLLSSPSIMVKSWAKLQPRTQSILSAFYCKKCASRKRFIEILRENKSYVLNEFCEWIPVEFADQIRSSWESLFFEK